MMCHHEGCRWHGTWGTRSTECSTATFIFCGHTLSLQHDGEVHGVFQLIVALYCRKLPVKCNIICANHVITGITLILNNFAGYFVWLGCTVPNDIICVDFLKTFLWEFNDWDNELTMCTWCDMSVRRHREGRNNNGNRANKRERANWIARQGHSQNKPRTRAVQSYITRAAHPPQQLDNLQQAQQSK